MLQMDWLLARNSGQQLPMASRYSPHRDCDRQQAHNYDPFEAAAVAIWVPASQSFDPVMPENSQDSKNPRTQRDRDLQPHAYLRGPHPIPLISAPLHDVVHVSQEAVKRVPTRNPAR